jgi:hypothetical protein
MIEKIFIPTIKRTNNQVTYDNLPEELKARVVMVIDPSERDQYDYPCEYLELPESIIGSWTQLAETRKFIHQQAGKIKYAVADDDIVILKRNSKYWTGESDMEKSRRPATTEEILKFHDDVSSWLDDEEIGIAGMAESYSPPIPTEYSNTKGAFSYVFYDGRKISEVIDDIDITSIRVSEDVLFLFECMSRGINTRVSNVYIYDNKSQNSKMFKDSRPIWEDMFEGELPKDHFQAKEHYDALRYIQAKHPHAMKIYEKEGKLKNTKYWSKIYIRKDKSSIEGFF